MPSSAPAFTIGGLTRPALNFDAAGHILLEGPVADFAALYGLKALYLGLPPGVPFPPIPCVLGTPVDSNATANAVAEGAAVNTPVGLTVSASHTALLPLTYSLTADSSGGGFKIDSTTGVVTVADPTKIDFESSPGHAYTVTARASDGIISTSQTFTIGVTDVAPSTPVDSNAAANTVAEGAAANTLVGITAAATDINGGAITWSLSADSSAGGFNINPTTGVISVADPTKIDYESTAPGHAYTVTASASDGTLSSTQTFTIAVTDVAPSGTDKTITILEDNNYSFVVGDFGFSDPGNGSPPNGLRAVEITTLPTAAAGTLTNNGTPVHAGDFISANDIAAGHLVFAPASNANGSPEAIFTFQVQDFAGPAVDTDPSPKTLTINVTPVNDAPSFTKGPDQTVLEDSGAHTVNGFVTGISPGPADESGQAVNFLVSNNNNALFSVQPSIDASGNLTYTTAVNAFGTATVSVQAHDNGGTANGGVDTSAVQTFAINLTAVNDAPSFTVGADQTALEDSGAQTVNTFITDISDGPNETGQTVNFLVSNNNNALFSVQPTIDANGNLTYTPAPNANGSATITLAIHDNGGTANGGVDTSATQTFKIGVTPVNDAPSFTKGADQTALEDSGPQTVLGWATAISPGPANESGQTVNFQVTGNTNTALFSVGPAIDASGNLTYTLAANANGNATVTVQAHDNGGTANGGVDTSAAQTFNIGVTPVNDVPSFMVGTDQSALEDSGLHTVNGFVTGISPGPAEESGQTVNFLVSNNNNALFAVAPSIDASGNLTYTLADNANGNATVTVRAHDNGGTLNGGVDTSAAQTFTIGVTPVNDVPSFTVGADQTAIEDTGPHTVNGFVTGISAGPTEESGQTVNFLVSNNNNALFAVAPSIDAHGNLTYTLADNANGSATVTVKAHDNGGTASGGVDTSAAQTFTIGVTPVDDAPVGTANALTILEDGSHTFTAADFGFTDPVDAASASGPNTFQDVIITTLPNPAAGALTLGGSPVTPGQIIPAAAIGGLVFTPAANANGSPEASFTFQVQDNGGTANGGVDTDPNPKTFTFNVTPVNDAPDGTDTTISAQGAHTIVASDFGFTDPIDAASASGANALLAVQITTLPSSGTLTLSGHAVVAGTFVGIADINAGNLVFTPSGNTNASFTFQVQDNGGTQNGGVDLDPTPNTLTINQNTPPTATADALSATEAGGLNNATPGTDPTGNVITGTGGATADTDAETPNSLTVIGFGTGPSGANNGTVDGSTQLHGAHGFLTLAADGTFHYFVDQTDAAVQALVPASTPLTDTFHYTITDPGGLTSTAVITVSIHGANDAPTANPDSTVAVEAGGVANGTPGINPTGNLILGTTSSGAGGTPDSDPDAGDTLTVQGVAAGTQSGPITTVINAVSGVDILSANNYGTLNVHTDGSYTYTVNNTNATVEGLRTSADTLQDVFSYTIKDAGGLTSTSQVTVTIDGQNDNPVANDDNITATEASGTNNTTPGHNPAGNLITGTGGNGETADTDVDSPAHGETITVQGVAAGNTGTVAQNVDPVTGIDVVGSHGTLHVNADGSYSYTVDNTAGNAVDQLNSGGSLPDTFTYTIKDAAGATSTAHVNVTIHGANDAPVAVADSATVVSQSVASVNVLANDTDVDTAHTSLTAIKNTDGAHGNVTLNTDGTFTYTATGTYYGADSFTYHTNDNGTPNLSSNIATVTLDVQPNIAYIDNSSTSATQDGSFANPFHSIGAFNTANTAANHFDIIYVEKGTGTYSDAGIVLKAGQVLDGQGVDPTYTRTDNSATVVLHDFDNSAGNVPTISVATGNAVTLSSGNTIAGINIATTGASAIGVADGGATVGSLKIGGINVTGVGKAIDISHGGTLAVDLNSLTSTGSSTQGVNLQGVGGHFNVVTGDIHGATGTDFNVVGGTLSSTYQGSITQANSAALLSVSGGHQTGTLDFNSATLSATNGTGLQFDNADGTYKFANSNTTTLSGGNAGIDITDGSSGTFSFGSNTAITNPTGNAFDLSASNASITYSGTIHANSGKAVNIDGETGNTVQFDTGSIVSTGQGISVQNSGSSAAIINFLDPTISLSTGANNGVTLANNSGGFIHFNPAGGGSGLDITTTSGTGFSATGGGTVDVTGTGNTISTGSGTALNISNTTIGANNVTFQSIASNGGSANGIILDTTGSAGGLHVVGNGNAAAHDGGTIANKSGADGSTTQGTGIYLNSTSDVQLTDMLLQNFQNFGIRGVGVNGFTFTNSTVNTTSGSNGTNTGTPFNEGSVSFSNLTGTSSITNSTISNGIGAGAQVVNTSGTLNLTVTGSTFSNNGIQGLLLTAGQNVGDTPTINANIATSSFSGNVARDIMVTANAGGAFNVNIGHQGVVGSGGTFNSSAAASVDIAHNSTANSSFNIENATFTQVVAGVPINIFNGTGSGAGTTFQGRIVGNSITGLNNGGFDGITLVGSGPGTITALVDNNTITNIGGNGIAYTGAQNSATNTANLTITNNTVIAPASTSGVFGIEVSAQASSSAHATVTATISGNDVTDATIDYRVDARFASSTFQMPGYTGAATDLTAVKAFVAANNKSNGATSTSAEVSASAGLGGGHFTNTPGGAATPLPSNPQPLFAAAGGVQASSPTPGETHLTQSELNSVIAAAIAQWAHAGASAAQLVALSAITFTVADLAGNIAGEQTPGHIVIDTDAGGHGWFVDSTPNDNSEFTHAANAAGTDLYTDPANASAGHLDLLTTVTHEMGHELGLPDLTSANDIHDLMYIDLADGERRLPGAVDVGQANDLIHINPVDVAQGLPVAADVAQAKAIAAPTGTTLTQAAEAALPASAQAQGGAPIVVGTAGNDTIDAGSGGKILFGDAGADTFVFGSGIHPGTAAAPSGQPLTHVADYSAAQGDSFDFSALTSAFHGLNVSDASLLRVVEDHSGSFATLQINTTPNLPSPLPGLALAPTWANVAQLDGAHAGDAVNVLVNSQAAAHLAHLHVDLLA
jgi:VCBS repeat-containing protein